MQVTTEKTKVIGGKPHKDGNAPINKALRIVIVVMLIALGVIFYFKQNQKHDANYIYYYQYTDDDNKISQSLKIYDKESGYIQSGYEVYLNGKVISTTDAETAIVTKEKADLSKHQDLQIKFSGDEDSTTYDVMFRE